MMGIQIVILWSDLLIWLLVAAGIGVGVLIARDPPLLSAWRRVGANRVGMASATVLLAFIVIGLLDSLHYRVALEGKPGQKVQYAIEVLSLLDAVATPLRTRSEKTYSEPFATRLYAKETIDVPGRGSVRDYPRLKHGGQHLGERENEVAADASFTAFRAGVLAFLCWLAVAGMASAVVGRGDSTAASGWQKIWRGETAFAWNAVLEDSHGLTDSDYFSLTLRDNTTNTNLVSRAYSSAGSIGSGTSGVTWTQFGNWYSSGWVVEQIDLAALSAVGHDFTLTLLASDCPYSGHAGYVYLDGFGAVNPPTGQVPEPGSLALLGLGFAGLAAARQRQKKAA